MSNKSTLRITRELSSVQKGGDLSISVSSHEKDVRNVKAIIVGPPETPYEFGFFEFAVKFKSDYPDTAPEVTGTTTNGGRCRFNPNIYANGKVYTRVGTLENRLLSFQSLTRANSTWRGESGEEWSSAQGLESILISIQSLMSVNPYENEPGYENSRSSSDKKNIQEYIDKIRHETLRISLIQRLEGYLGIYSDGTVAEPPPLEMPEEADLDEDVEEKAASFEPFRDLCKRRFLWYYESYFNAIDAGEKKRRSGEAFTIMPFEGGGNCMSGKFDYPELRRRLLLVRQVLDRETMRWSAEGAVQVKRDTPFASQLQRQYQQVAESYRKNESVTIDVDLAIAGNPFVWQLTYFGRPMTHLDGGMFRITMAISPRFPEEQPRVTFETPLFHHRVANDGTLCYLPRRADDLQSHIEGIVEAIEEEHPPYDPRTLVNVQASRLFWGSEADKKQYNRQLRRAVQRSVE